MLCPGWAIVPQWAHIACISCAAKWAEISTRTSRTKGRARCIRVRSFGTKQWSNRANWTIGSLRAYISSERDVHIHHCDPHGWRCGRIVALANIPGVTKATGLGQARIGTVASFITEHALIRTAQGRGVGVGSTRTWDGYVRAVRAIGSRRACARRIGCRFSELVFRSWRAEVPIQACACRFRQRFCLTIEASCAIQALGRVHEIGGVAKGTDWARFGGCTSALWAKVSLWTIQVHTCNDSVAVESLGADVTRRLPSGVGKHAGSALDRRHSSFWTVISRGANIARLVVNRRRACRVGDTVEPS